MISTTPWDSSVRRCTTSAAAPRLSASATYRWPSVLAPFRAKKTPPGTTSRESVWYVPNVLPTCVPPISPPPVASRSSRRVSFIRLVEPVALVGRYAPVNDHGLGDLLPHRGCGEVAVVQRPVVLAARVVRLAHHHEHRELGVDSGEEADVRRPYVQRVLTVDGNLRRPGL